MKPYSRGASGRRWLGALAVALVFGTRVSAHDFWIEVSDFHGATGAPIHVHLKIGEHFSGEAVPRNDARIARFFAVGPDGERDIIGRDGAAPAGFLRFDSPGISAIGYQSKPSVVSLHPKKFEQYLLEEGLDHVIQERQARGEQGRQGRERFARSVKALIQTGDTADAGGYERTLGLPLELVAETNPFSDRSDDVRLRLLNRGRPLEGALVFMWRKDDRRTAAGELVARMRTDAAGHVVVPRGRGVWLVKAVHMTRVNSRDADWESVWTSLTYRIR